jgi:hypothetical protein
MGALFCDGVDHQVTTLIRMSLQRTALYRKTILRKPLNVW